MTENPYQQAAQLFQLLSHQARLRILDELRQGEACVCHLQAILRRPQPYISQQLRVLREAGVIEGRKDGLFVYYSLTNQRVRQVLNGTLGPAKTVEPSPNCVCPRCHNEEVEQTNLSFSNSIVMEVE